MFSSFFYYLLCVMIILLIFITSIYLLVYFSSATLSNFETVPLIKADSLNFTGFRLGIVISEISFDLETN